MLDVMVAINAAEFLVWGYSSARAINHFEWTNRKIDMSAGGGPNSGGWAGEELRRRVAARMSGSVPEPEPEPEPEEDDDVYRTYQPDAGPDSGGIWIAGPGFCEVIPSMEYYDILVKVGAAKPVTSVTHREFDVLKDSYRRWPSLLTGGQVWDTLIRSFISDTDIRARDMLAYTNQDAAAAKG